MPGDPPRSAERCKLSASKYRHRKKRKIIHNGKRNGEVAQSVEQEIEYLCVGGKEKDRRG